MRYFFAKSIAYRQFDGVTFEPAEMHGGGLTGIFATDDDVIISKLSVNREVEEIDEVIYLKKKLRLGGLSENLLAYEHQSHMSLRRNQGVVVAGSDRVIAGESPLTIDDAINLRQVPV